GTTPKPLEFQSDTYIEPGNTVAELCEGSEFWTKEIPCAGVCTPKEPAGRSGRQIRVGAYRCDIVTQQYPGIRIQVFYTKVKMVRTPATNNDIIVFPIAHPRFYFGPGIATVRTHTDFVADTEFQAKAYRRGALCPCGHELAAQAHTKVK